ncbi:MAG: IS1182 family transposase [Acidobacteria bacterium]|nr:IS1182 family transposase [Acidobacteriota bacterium]
MSRYVVYNPDQDQLLPSSLREELGEGHLAIFVHRLVERLDLRAFEAEHAEAGRPSYPPQLLLKVWLYAYSLGITSSRRIEQRLHEDLGFRYLAGGWKPDHWTLNQFRQRHPKKLNDVFTQVLEAARRMGLARLGRVAIDSTRVAANASPDKSQRAEALRRERARLRQRIRRWQQQCNREETEPAGGTVAVPADWAQRLEAIPRQLEQLSKSGQQRSSRTDPESRYLRRRGGFCLGYTGEIAVSEDHLIVAQRVHQAPNDTGSLAGMTQLVEQQCHERPAVVLADSGYYSMPELEAVEKRGTIAYVPDRLSAIELAGGAAAKMNARQQRRHPGLLERRQRLRDPAVRATYARRKTMVEPVFGVLKQQRGLRQFRCRGLAAVSTEWTLATTAYNLTRLFRLQS